MRQTQTSEAVLTLGMCASVWHDGVRDLYNRPYIHNLVRFAEALLTAPGAIETDMALTLMAQVDDATVAMVKTFMVRWCGRYSDNVTTVRARTRRFVRKAAASLMQFELVHGTPVITL